MNIYIAIHKYGHEYSDEAHFFESEDTLSELVKKELDIVPELKDKEMVFFVIENTTWQADLIKKFYRGYTVKQWWGGQKKTSWKGKFRLWKWDEFGSCHQITGLKWILEHAKEIKWILEHAKEIKLEIA